MGVDFCCRTVKCGAKSTVNWRMETGTWIPVNKTILKVQVRHGEAPSYSHGMEKRIEIIEYKNQS